MDLRSYGLVTASYWGFTLTDGALRMLVLLHFHEQGFTPVNLAFLFLLYEFFGVVTNLFGGWIGSRSGLKITLFAGLGVQVLALIMLSFVQETWLTWLSVSYVMAAQALSGIAKDLTKMSSKSAIKLLVKDSNGTESSSTLFKWVAILTGSKNALKGLGFFIGGVLLSTLGFQVALWSMAGALAVVLALAIANLKQDIGKSKDKVKFKQLFSKSRDINVLSIARLFLFGARDVWFVVGLPIFLKETLDWSFNQVGGFLAAWVIGYGFVQAAAPKLLARRASSTSEHRSARVWGIALALVSGGIAVALQLEFHTETSVVLGLVIFGVVFAINSSVHSFLILAYTDADKVALNVGFYYMANACGRLLGTLLSGVVYLQGGLTSCLWVSTAMLVVAAATTVALRPYSTNSTQNEKLS